MKELIYFIVLVAFLVLWYYIIEPFISEIFARKSIEYGELSKLKSLGFKDVENRLFGKHKDYVITIKKSGTFLTLFIKIHASPFVYATLLYNIKLMNISKMTLNQNLIANMKVG